MCLIFFSFQEHSEYKMIIAGNRDEFYHRKTAPAQFWEDHPQVLAGRDLEAMGTWMGITRAGKICMLTNYRDPQNINVHAPSRGHLVSDYLINPISADRYLDALSANGSIYNGFNLIAGDADNLFYYSNYAQGVRKLTPGFYGLSNHLLDTPWPKVVGGKSRVVAAISKQSVTVDALFDALYDDHVAADEALPSTGLSLERERALSSMFIKTKDYGSRCSTVVLMDYQNNVTFVERSYDINTFQFTTAEYHFTTEKHF